LVKYRKQSFDDWCFIMPNPKACIKFNEFDLLRIIPFPAGSEYDFKINFLDNDYELRMHNRGKYDFLSPTDDFKLREWEITYHKSQKDKPCKFHLKSISKPTQYFDLPLKDIVDPIKSPEFPIPFLKLGINSSLSTYKSFRFKKDYKIIDLEKQNVLELYIISSQFNPEVFARKWSFFDLLYIAAPMEYFVSGKLKRGFINPKLNSMGETNGYRREVIEINDDIALLCNIYTDKAIDGNKQNPFVSIYENGDFLKYLALAPIEDGSKYGKKPAYIKQLRRNKTNLTTQEYNYFREFFEKLEKETDTDKIDGIVLPQAGE